MTMVMMIFVAAGQAVINKRHDLSRFEIHVLKI